MPSKTNWAQAIQPLLKKYKGKKHPLEYSNLYQLLVMVILSAQDSDRHINQVAPEFFKAFPNLKSLSKATPEALYPYIGKVRNFANKAKWITELSKQLKSDDKIPLTMAELTELPGIGRKSANVIKREAKAPPEGVMVDLHVLRVAPRLGIATGTDPKKIEKQIMEATSKEDWGEVGMAMSHLGREICRPRNPKHDECVMKDACEFHLKKKKS